MNHRDRVPAGPTAAAADRAPGDGRRPRWSDGLLPGAAGVIGFSRTAPATRVADPAFGPVTLTFARMAGRGRGGLRRRVHPGRPGRRAHRSDPRTVLGDAAASPGSRPATGRCGADPPAQHTYARPDRSASRQPQPGYLPRHPPGTPRPRRPLITHSRTARRPAWPAAGSESPANHPPPCESRRRALEQPGGSAVRPG
jgi:hypothetical protein